MFFSDTKLVLQPETMFRFSVQPCLYLPSSGTDRSSKNFSWQNWSMPKMHATKQRNLLNWNWELERHCCRRLLMNSNRRQRNFLEVRTWFYTIFCRVDIPNCWHFHCCALNSILYVNRVQCCCEFTITSLLKIQLHSITLLFKIQCLIQDVSVKTIFP